MIFRTNLEMLNSVKLSFLRHPVCISRFYMKATPFEHEMFYDREGDGGGLAGSRAEE